MTIPTPLNQFDRRFEELLKEVRDLHARKRHDYTGGGDPLANYRATAEFACKVLGITDVSPSHIMLLRMIEKAQRLLVLLHVPSHERADSETLTDTCKDIAIIALLVAIAEEMDGS